VRSRPSPPSLAALVFAGYLEFYRLDDGAGLFRVAAAVTLAVMAWRTERRGVVGASRRRARP
jgi:hypothetical protein